MAEESELESNKSSLFESLGSLVGMLTGGPVGALVGGIGGALLSGKSGEDAFRSGIGSFFQGATMGAPGLALNALGGAGGSAGNIGQGIMGAISDPRALQLAAMSSGAPPLAQAMMMGLAASSLGQLFRQYRPELNVIAGTILTIFALHFLGLLKFSFFYREFRGHIHTCLSPFFNNFIRDS